MSTNNQKNTYDSASVVAAYLKKTGLTPDAFLDNTFKTGAGTLSSALGDSMYGINHQLAPQSLPINKDHYGLTLFTRPMLNLSDENLRAERCFSPLLSNNPSSMGRAIRCMLDPHLGRLNKWNTRLVESPFVDNKQAFIPLLTNSIVSLSGFPDSQLPIWTSHDGRYRESYSMVDGILKNYTGFPINASFRNLIGDPITLLFFVWELYAANVFEGTMVAQPYMVVEREIDYQTRVYRIILDPTKTWVRKLGATGICYPTGITTGAAFDYTNDRPWIADNSQIGIPFQAHGAIYYDPILIYEFNQTVSEFNLDMADANREKAYVKVSIGDLPKVANRGYPRINPETLEMEWWVSRDIVKQAVADYNSVSKYTTLGV